MPVFATFEAPDRLIFNVLTSGRKLPGKHRPQNPSSRHGGKNSLSFRARRIAWQHVLAARPPESLRAAAGAGPGAGGGFRAVLHGDVAGTAAELRRWHDRPRAAAVVHRS